MGQGAEVYEFAPLSGAARPQPTWSAGDLLVLKTQLLDMWIDDPRPTEAYG